MATFKERYEELFGPTPDYDPVQIDELARGGQRRAIDIQAGVPSASPRMALPPMPTPPVEEQGAITGLLKTGTGMLGEALVGIPEYGARQLGADRAAGYLQGVRDDLADWREGVYARMNPEVIDMKGRELMTLDPNKTIWKGGPLDVGEAVLYKIVEQVPMLLATLVPGGVIMRAGASAKGIAYLGASEAGLSLGFIQNDIADGIAEMTAEELVQESPRFAELMQTMDEEEARSELTREAQGMAPIIGGLAVGAISAAAGRYLAPVFDDAAGLSLRQRVGRTAISEGFFQEGPQESFEQIAGNVAAAVYDGDRQALEGVVESYAQGALLGSIMGGGVGGLLGASPQEESEVPADVRAAIQANLKVDDPGAVVGGDVFEGPGTPPAPPPNAQPTEQTEMFPGPEQVQRSSDPRQPGTRVQGAYVMPDAPVTEPQQDILGQIQSLKRGERDAVYLAPDQNIGGIAQTFGGLIVEENFDGKGGTMVFADQATRDYAVEQRDGTFRVEQTPSQKRGYVDGVRGTMRLPQKRGEPVPASDAKMQAIIGSLTGAGEGKPVDGSLAVQRLDDAGAVIQETLVATGAEAEQLAAEWGPNSRVLTAEDAIARRQLVQEQEFGQIVDASPAGRRQGDLFAAPPAALPEVKGETTAERPAKESRGRYRVEFLDREGGAIEDKTFSDQRKAEKYADELADKYKLSRKDAQTYVRLTPVRELPKQKTQPTQDEQAAEVARRKKERPINTPGEEAVEEIRRTTPFEERPGPSELKRLAEARTEPQLAEALIESAKEQMAKETDKAIGGFFPPESYTFNSSANEARYKRAWQKLYEADFVGKNKGVIPLEHRGTVSAKYKRQRTKALKELATIRALDKPKRKVQSKIEKAAAIDQRKVRGAQREAARIAKEIDQTTQDIAGELPEMTRAEVDKLTPLELDLAFEQAIRYLEGQDQRFGKTKEEVKGKVWKEDVQDREAEAPVLTKDQAAKLRKERSPGNKRKLILRALNKRRNKAETDSRVAGVPYVTATSKEGIKTDALTSVTQKADESRADTKIRLAKARKVYKDLSGMIQKALKRLKAIEIARDPTGELTPDGHQQLLAKAYLEQSIQLANSLVKARNTSPSNIKLAESLLKMLTKVQTMSDFKLAELMSDQYVAMEQFVARRAGTEGRTQAKTDKKSARFWTFTADGEVFNFDTKNEAELAHDEMSATADDVTAIVETKVSEREAAVANRNKKVMTQLRRLLRLEILNKDPRYTEVIRPFIQKFSEAYFTSKGYHTPSLEEAWEVAAVLREFRLNIDIPGTAEWRLDPEEATAYAYKSIYLPLKQAIRGLGFDFDEQGDMIVNYTDEGKLAWSPTESMLTNRLNIDSPMKTKEVTIEVKEREKQSIADFNKEWERNTQQRTDAAKRLDAEATRQEAARHVRATTILRAFRKIVDNSKSTLDRLIDAEQKLIADLKREGFIGANATTFVTINIPGRNVITLRRSSSDLANRRITKAQARRRMAAVTKKMTQELAQYSNLVTKVAGQQARDTSGLELMNDAYEYVYESEGAVTLDHTKQANEAGSALGDLLLDRTRLRSGNTVLQHIIDHTAEGSVYNIAARKLAALDLRHVTVQWDHNGYIKKKSVNGVYRGKTSQVIIAKKPMSGAKMVQVTLHELTHAATQESLRVNQPLRALLTDVQSEARQKFMDSFPDLELPYGLRPQDEVDEFVAEMFSNKAMQELSKTVVLDSRMTMWDRFKSLVRQVLGWVKGYEITAFDLVMELEPALFEYVSDQTANVPDMYSMDVPLGNVAKKFYDKINQTIGIEDRVRNTESRLGRGKFAHALMTMRQLRERYEKFFGGDKGPLARYMNAFNGRNAKNNELMQLPERISRTWTKLREANPEMEMEYSRVATESTLYGLDPSKPATHDRNKKNAAAQPEKFAELKRRYEALSPEYKKLWSEVTKYYSESLVSETKLLLLNALRGVVTKGGVSMEVDAFNAKYNEQNIDDFNTTEKLMAEFGEFLGDTDKEKSQMVSLLHRLSNVPMMNQGVYFPLMRYGDYVVYASKEWPSETFPDSAAANKRAADLRAEDPTLTISVFKNEGGKFEVRVKESEFITGESAAEVEQYREELIAKYGKDNVGDVDIKSPKFETRAAIDSNAALNTIITALGDNAAAQHAIKQFYLRSLSDQSFRKREIKRQNRRGVGYDLQHRNFANYAKQSAYYRSQLQYGWQMAKGLSDMDTYIRSRKQSELVGPAGRMSTEQLRNVWNTLHERDKMMTDPQEVHSIIRGGIALTQFYMLTSASYHIINSSQPWMVTLPTMSGRHGWGAAFTEMKRAQGLIKDDIFDQIKSSGGGFKLLYGKQARGRAEDAFGVFEQLTRKLKGTPELEMLNKLRKTHVLEVSPLTELREIASGKSSAASRALDASRVMAHLVEVNNRVLTAVAAYRLQYKAEIANGASEEAAVAAATAYAEDMVSQTQFDYSTANKPPIFMKLPLMFQFMQWSQHIYAHLIRNFAGAMQGNKEARNALLGVLGTHAMVGGLIGVALQPIKMAFGLAMMAFGDEDEPYTFRNAVSGATFDRSIEKITADLFGTTASTVISRGIPAALGADLSTRMSMGTLYFIDLRGETPENILGALGSSFGGAFVNQMLQFGKGVQYLGSGDVAKGVEQLTPKFLRDIVRAGRLATDGLVNNAGDKVLDTADLGFVDVALQAIGFTPTTTSQFYQGQAAIKDVEAYVRDRKSRLLKEFRTVDPRDRGDVIRQVLEFNRAYPQEAITRSSLLRNLKSKAEREGQYRRYGAAIDDKKASLYKGYGEPYR